MTDAEKRRLLSSLSQAKVNECARQIANAGTEDYLPDHFERTFGPEAALLAGLGYANRLAPALKKLGFAISLKMFPGNKRGYSVHRL